MRYTKRDREMAARICSGLAAEHARISVSGCDFTTDRWTWANSVGFAVALGASDMVPGLVTCAIMATARDDGPDPIQRAFSCAEAEALLRTGWEPS